jgi:alkanesulfonate monooxygenase SsuD/methylene tetrahydromethanopterin reductase-like flavin-dependent oxidoreductase (luciferase family)
MELGLFADLQLPRPWSRDAEARLLREALEQVELADRLGYDYVWAQEHHFLEEYCHSSAPEVLLGAMAARTTRIRLGHGITVMSPRVNHPVRVAERIATLDLLSNGRVEWGTGESGTRIELESFEIPFVDKRAMWFEGVREATRMLALEPYPGHEGQYFSMPSRNVVPKPQQTPHPPLWAACSNRESLRLAARLGVGALTFAFIDPAEARFWVEEYHEIFEKECEPIGLDVNPRVAMLTGFMCQPTTEEAVTLGMAGAQFFGFALMHYWKNGAHRPGVTNLWSEFGAKMQGFAAADRDRRKAGAQGIGSPDAIREGFRRFEDAGVDQLILLQQAGNYQHADICRSLELFAREVMPEIKERHARAASRRRAIPLRVADALARARQGAASQTVEAWPRAWAELTPLSAHAAERRPGATAFWRAQVAGVPRPRSGR